MVLPRPGRGAGTLIPSAQRLVWAARQPLGNAALEEMATHSSILACRLPGTEEPVKAAIYGVAQSGTRLMRLSSSSSSSRHSLKGNIALCMRAFFSCMAWRGIPNPLFKLHRRLDSL